MRHWAKLIRAKLKKACNPGPWEARKCLWPYPEGYATYNVKTHTILDTGLTKEQAEKIAERLNKQEQS